MALLNEKLFIVRKETTKLEVYVRNTHGFNRHSNLLDVPNLVDAVDICSCKKNMCLYIMDKKEARTSKEVIKLDKEGRHKCHWPTKDKAGGYLSTTAQGNLIITVKYRNMLLEYSPDGNWVRDIKLKKRIFPWHAIMAGNDHYFVSHGTIFDPLHKVCLVNKEGEVVMSFGGESGLAEDQLNIPNYLADASNGCVMVADLNNDRVLLLDSNLKLKANIASQCNRKFRCPRRVCVSEGLLVVVTTADASKEAKLPEAGNSREGTDGEDTATESDALLRMKDSDTQQNAEENCTILVFKRKTVTAES